MRDQIWITLLIQHQYIKGYTVDSSP